MPRSLLEMVESADETRRSIPLAAKGFRPFFLLASVFAAVMLPAWLLAFRGLVDGGGYFDATYWHAHEMVFGYAVAVVAGFLLTAVANWTPRETLVGAPLLALAALWVLGRLAVTLAPSLPRLLPIVVDTAFLPALLVAIARPLIATKSYRNFVMGGVLAALFAANVAMHLDVLGILPGWQRRGALVGIDVLLFVMLLVSGRVIPMFTRNATGVSAIRSSPRLDALTLAGMAFLTGLDVVAPGSTASAVIAGTTGALAIARTAHWGARHSPGQSLLWILHVGHAWIAVGLILRALSHWIVAIPLSAATHAWTVGAIGSLTLGMMARVALGHTGRLLSAPRTITAAFVLVTASAIVRVVSPFVPTTIYRPALDAAGTLFGAAFLLYAVVYAPILIAPRVDGKPG